MIAIENGVLSEVQEIDDEERLKYIGHSDAGIITVITEDTSTQIVTAWHSSAEEVSSATLVEGIWYFKDACRNN